MRNRDGNMNLPEGISYIYLRTGKVALQHHGEIIHIAATIDDALEWLAEQEQHERANGEGSGERH